MHLFVPRLNCIELKTIEQRGSTPEEHCQDQQAGSVPTIMLERSNKTREEYLRTSPSSNLTNSNQAESLEAQLSSCEYESSQ
jgi:hypothetical protein